MTAQSPKATLLVVDDERHQRESLQMILEDEGYRVAVASDGREAIAKAAEVHPEVVLTDLKMPGLSGMEVIRALLEGPLPPRILLITAHGSVERAREAHKLGAFDYMSKPVVADELLFRVERALETYRLSEKALKLERRLKSDPLEAIVGESASMREVFRLVEKIAPTASTVLIRGESGTGKELVARAVHSRSPRGGKAFFAINCAAIPESLLESELFGHERGAFTGADARKVGLFEAASGSTLFLDEIGDLSMPLQGKILRALQEKEVRRVGGNETIPVDVRVVAATNRDLEAMMKAGQFREDLFYRLNVIPILLPPLRERTSDVPALVQRFLDRANSVHGTSVERVSEGALALLTAHTWPGNIRQLESVVERAVLLCEGNVVRPDDLPLEIRLHTAPASRPYGFEIPAEGIDIEELERQLIVQAMERSGWVIAKACRLLGLTYRTLQYRLEKFGLRRPG
ncbi:sigma-54-dependent Fis family transcriptional regulator [Acidobacteria bacterium ACD]|nr:MAG: sigma-54-dependent Fis family transcriptional regulator [Acidobacteriota bacterium]MCE7956642.1 sigma-54-dependent Fis family transcriptional regulator [Acidobacteria bacterium ACB2]MDL1951046.1 sigma-54-dependent Fis family transcriptional regulator [Acidobacteria bacterium ACD]